MPSRLIDVSEITPGMELTEPVKNRNGQILLNNGIVLEEKHKLILKTWGVKKVSIKSDEPEEESSGFEVPAQDLNGLRKILDWQPRNFQENELIKLALIYNKPEVN